MISSIGTTQSDNKVFFFAISCKSVRPARVILFLSMSKLVNDLLFVSASAKSDYKLRTTLDTTSQRINKLEQT